MTTVIPALQIGERLGSGYFGEVFLAQDIVHGQVAVKVLGRKPEHADDEWIAVKRGFLAEAQHLSNATHRNVVQVHGIEEFDDCIRFSMAYCPGGSLQAPYESGPMPLSAVRRITLDVLLGLIALHSRGMLHRDIKPGNILLDRTGVAKLGDFGLVTDDLLLGYGSAAGYADHIAFEVWHGRGTSAKSDIWALGMTLYRLLHGQVWYVLETEAPDEAVAAGGFADRLRWLPHVPKPWRRVIRKMLQDNPDERFATAREVLNAVSGLPIEPAWQVPVLTTHLVRWEKTSPKRVSVVEWRLHSERRHEWKAWSQPLGVVGRTKSLAKSDGIIGRVDLNRQLESYFSD